MMWPLVGIIFLSFSFFLICCRSMRKKHCHPGPSTFAVIQNFKEFGLNPLGTLTRWKAQYGPVVFARIGEFRVVVLNDADHMAKAFTSHALNSRPPFLPAMSYAGGSDHGTLTSAEDTWVAVRKTTVKNVTRARLLTSPIAGESPTMSKDMLPLMHLFTEGRKVCLADVRRKLYIPIANLVWRTLTGEEFPEECKPDLENQLFRLQKALWQPLLSPVWFLPTFAKLFSPTKKILKELENSLAPLHARIAKLVEQINGESDEEEGLNFVKSFIQDCSSFPILKGKEANHLKGQFFVLFHTATETVGNLFSWALLWLSLFPDAQEKLADELINDDSLDLTRLPYTRAAIQEILRLSSTAPFANFHWSVQDYKLDNGMIIPKETVVIGNLYGLHHDPEVWGEDVEEFHPERFLCEEKTSPTRIMMPFSCGLRSCPGQNFAKNFLLFALSKTLKEFKFSWDSQVPRPTPEEIMTKSLVSIFRFVPNFEVCVDRRDHQTE